MTIKFTIDILERGKITAKDYSTRASILWKLPLFAERKRSTPANLSLNANCNVAHLADYLFESIPSYITEYNCDKCGYSHKRTSPTYNINTDEILKNGFNNMQQAIDDTTICAKKATCYKCKNTTTRTITCGPHIIIDTSITTDKNYMKDYAIQQRKHTLNDVAKTITIENDNYSLAGLSSYINYGHEDSAGHYVAFTYTGLHWYKFDDMPAKRYTANVSEEIYPHLVLYVKTKM